MNVTVFGTGYVGLVQGAVLSSVGHKVICVDVDEKKVEMLNNGQIPIYEPGLESLVAEGIKAQTLKFTTDASMAVQHGRVLFIAVGTPPDEDGSADLRYVLQVADTIASEMKDEKVIVNKSTVPVGTADKVTQTVSARLQRLDKSISFTVVSNPEFLKEGSAVNDCMRPDRIIIGTSDKKAEEIMREVYAPFVRNHDRIIVMDNRSAELTKYAANCMLATKISFMNEMSNLAEKLGADIEAVRIGIGSDPRIGYHFIYPGCGYGGSCFPKDVQALIRTANEIGCRPQILEAVEQTNDLQKDKLFDYVTRYFDGDLKGKTLALWGLSFKPNTDDMREASSRRFMELAWQAGVKIQAYDPEAMEEAQRIYGHRKELQLLGTKESALNGADGLVICTEWSSFRSPDFEFIRNTLNTPVIFDGRNLYDPVRVEGYGIAYYAIGRGRSVSKIA
jgi:UDPglucose 6-dehydrogenase